MCMKYIDVPIGGGGRIRVRGKKDSALSQLYLKIKQCVLFLYLIAPFIG